MVDRSFKLIIVFSDIAEVRVGGWCAVKPVWDRRKMRSYYITRLTLRHRISLDSMPKNTLPYKNWWLAKMKWRSQWYFLQWWVSKFRSKLIDSIPSNERMCFNHSPPAMRTESPSLSGTVSIPLATAITEQYIHGHYPYPLGVCLDERCAERCWFGGAEYLCRSLQATEMPRQITTNEKGSFGT